VTIPQVAGLPLTYSVLGYLKYTNDDDDALSECYKGAMAVYLRAMTTGIESAKRIVEKTQPD
jgi:hypothetical protein